MICSDAFRQSGQRGSKRRFLSGRNGVNFHSVTQAGQSVFGKGRFRNDGTFQVQGAGEGMNQLVGPVSEDEAFRRQTVVQGGFFPQFLHVRRRVGRDAVHGAPQGARDEFRGAFRSQVDAEVQNVAFGAPGIRRQGFQVSSV